MGFCAKLHVLVSALWFNKLSSVMHLQIFIALLHSELVIILSHSTHITDIYH